MEWAINAAQAEIGAWSTKTFPSVTFESTMIHIQHEVDELASCVKRTGMKEEVAGELADIFHLLVQMSALYGIDLQDAIMAKFAKNQRRTWKAPDEFGVVYHESEGDNRGEG